MYPKGAVPMRFITSFLCVLLLGGMSLGQKKLLVSPYQEVMPIPQGSSAQKMIAKYEKERAAARLTAGCNSGSIFGFDPQNPFHRRSAYCTVPARETGWSGLKSSGDR